MCDQRLYHADSDEVLLGVNWLRLVYKLRVTVGYSATAYCFRSVCIIFVKSIIMVYNGWPLFPNCLKLNIDLCRCQLFSKWFHTFWIIQLKNICIRTMPHETAVLRQWILFSGDLIAIANGGDCNLTDIDGLLLLHMSVYISYMHLSFLFIQYSYKI